MSSQANLKHASTEPVQLSGKGENANSTSHKREGRRAAGRAAALRGASDSDCSGETASLSADSGELQNNLTTIVLPPTVVPQTRSKHAKNRSRRRGSEWEVLEGLKDGQRFERRPEVFNGYLHKKRKWPLKGWHKRYFVVDGGILVYARSPGDVARGRLHGSVDVGLSVISAKARRRRIDIDADEFIYHLRAKTVEAFHSWLNVLKVHRLYRQHLLTFGVRESVPRINVADDTRTPESISRVIPFQLSWTNSSLSSMSLSSPFEEEITNNHPIKPKQKSVKIKKSQSPSKCHSQLIHDIRSFSKFKNYPYPSGSPIMQRSKSLVKQKSQSLSNYSATRHKDILRVKNNTNGLGSPLSQRSKSSIKPNTLSNSSPKPKKQTCQLNNVPVKNCKVCPTNASMKLPRERTSKNTVENNTNKTILKPKTRTSNTSSDLLTSWKSKIDDIKSELTSSKTVVGRNFNEQKEKHSKEPPNNKTDRKKDNVSYSKITFSTLSVDSDSTDSSDISDDDDVLKNNPHLGEFMESMFGEKTKRIFTKDWLSKLQFQHSKLDEFTRSEVGSYKGDCQYNQNLLNREYTTLYGDTKEFSFNNNNRSSHEGNVVSPTEKAMDPNYFDIDARSENLREFISSNKPDFRVNNDDKLNARCNREQNLASNKNTQDLGVINVATLKDQNELVESHFTQMHKDINGHNFQEVNKHLKESILQKESVLNLGDALIQINNLCKNKPSVLQTDCTNTNISCVKESMEKIIHNIVLKTLQRVDENLVDQANKLKDGNNFSHKEIDINEILSLLKKLKDLSEKFPVSDEIKMLYSFVNSMYGYSKINSDDPEACYDITKSKNGIPIKIERKPNNEVKIINGQRPANSTRKKSNIHTILKRNEIMKIRKSIMWPRSIKQIAINNSFVRTSKMVDKSMSFVPNMHKQITIANIVQHDKVEKSTSAIDFKGELIISNLAEEVRHMLKIKKSFSLHNIVKRDVGSQSYFDKRQIFYNDSIVNNSTAQEIINNLYQEHVPKSDLNRRDTGESIKNCVSYTISTSRNTLKLSESFSFTQNQSDIDSDSLMNRSVIDARFYNNEVTSTVHKPSLLNGNTTVLYKSDMKIKGDNFNVSLPDSDQLKFHFQQAEDVNNLSIKSDNIFDEVILDPSDYSKVGKKVNLEEIPGIINKVVIDVFNFLSPFCKHNLQDHIYMRCDIEKVKTMRRSKSCFTFRPSIVDLCQEKDKSKTRVEVKKSASCELFSILKNRKWRDHSDQEIWSEKSSSGLGSPSSGNIRAPQAGFVSGTPGGRLASWIVESGGPLENASRELGQAQLSVQQLQRLLDSLELQQQVHHDTDVSLDGASSSVKKDRRKFGLRKKKSASSKGGSVDLQMSGHLDSSFSHAALSALTAPPSPGGGAPFSAPASLPIACAGVAARPQSLPGADALGSAGVPGGPTSITSLTPDHQLREDFTILAKDLVSTLKGVVSTLVCERARLRAAVETAESPPAHAALRASLAAAVHQNTELKNRLSRIHDTSDLAEISSVGPASEMASRQFHASLSYSSSCVSASEFFDAEEHDGESDPTQPIQLVPHVQGGVIELEGDTSSEAGSLSSEEGSVSSDNSDAPLIIASGVAGDGEGTGGSSGRRARLPCPRPNPAGPSLWNLLYKNIGKDLSQISMPVTINEPLNMLQRLCEELEYSELLDAAAECSGGAERAALVAAFAVSAYASSAHRAASKPFNPLLGETYECVRQDRGFRFISEQVSHHPPVSVCHAESPRWTFWQEARIRTKFWGKSMEFQPAGRVHVRLHATGEHYTWNKVTTCVHNLFGGQRWVDQYGDMQITSNVNHSCKLNFIKASSWSTSRHEVRGAVTAGGARPTRITGRWSEAIYAGDPPAARCLWRHGAMPPDHELYYGFTRFAMELNEMETGLKEKLPGTDTRLRPDQRALEQGDVDTAEALKLKLEQAQRERRRRQPYHTPRWFRKDIENGEEVWVFTGEYWKAREAGFPNEPDPGLW